MSNHTNTATPSVSTDCPATPRGPVLERIDARIGEVGGSLTVRRAVPSRARRMVGAWCFLDHAGPAHYAPGDGLKVGPHPHIGLQTFTWMIEGAVMHTDSLGYEQLIRPGQVNLMTAGRGIAHAEESPAEQGGRLHLAQLWIALPDAERHREPAFHHYPQLPQLGAGGFTVTVLAGSALGARAPALVYSPLVGLDVTSTQAATTNLALEPAFEHAALVLEGAAEVEGERLEPGTLLYLGIGRETVAIRSAGAARLLIVGGAPFGEEILLWWNFVGRSNAEVAQATEDWNAGRHFGEVRGSALQRLRAPELKGVRLKE